MKTIQIKYLRNVTCPADQAGRKGETREVAAPNARLLIRRGFAVEAKKETAAGGKKEQNPAVSATAKN